LTQENTTELLERLKRLLAEDPTLAARLAAITGDGNVVGDHNVATVNKMSAGDYAIQIGQLHLTLSPEQLRSLPVSAYAGRWHNPKDGKEMVRVPAGKFLYGDDKNEVELPEFWIDKAPVTNAEYARFVAETGHKPPKHWEGKTPRKKTTDHPVVNVSWHDAVAYAKWAGGRLPTEQEWEKAARGTDGREYPWGGWAKGHCNSWEAGMHETTPVGQYSPQGDSPYGCADMAGNVWEWTASEGEPGRDRRVLCGGSWRYIQRYARCVSRGRSIPDYFDYDVGLRVVVSPGSPAF